MAKAEPKIQRCVNCDAPTGRCEEDDLYVIAPATGVEWGPLCEECLEAHEGGGSEAQDEQINDALLINDNLKPYRNTGALIRKCRIADGLSLRRVGKIIECSDTTLSNIERGLCGPLFWERLIVGAIPSLHIYELRQAIWEDESNNGQTTAAPTTPTPQAADTISVEPRKRADGPWCKQCGTPADMVNVCWSCPICGSGWATWDKPSSQAILDDCQCATEIAKAIKSTLKSHTLQYSRNYDGDGLDLMDKLTPDGDYTVERGLQEIEHMTDDLTDAVLAVIGGK